MNMCGDDDRTRVLLQRRDAIDSRVSFRNNNGDANANRRAHKETPLFFNSMADHNSRKASFGFASLTELQRHMPPANDAR